MRFNNGGSVCWRRPHGISRPSMDGQVFETCPALSPAVKAPYAIWSSKVTKPTAAKRLAGDHGILVALA